MVPAPGSCANAFSLGTAVLATDRRAGWPSPECLQVKRSVRAEAFWDHQSPCPSCAEERLRGRGGTASYSGSVPGQVSQWLWQEEPLVSYCEGQDTGLQGLGGSPRPQRLQ